MGGQSGQMPGQNTESKESLPTCSECSQELNEADAGQDCCASCKQSTIECSVCQEKHNVGVDLKGVCAACVCMPLLESAEKLGFF